MVNLPPNQPQRRGVDPRRAAEQFLPSTPSPSIAPEQGPVSPATQTQAPRSHAVREDVHDAEHASPRVRTRRRSAAVHNDPYHIPEDLIPEGTSFEWKRFSNVGAEDPYYIAAMREQGWEPVDAKSQPSLVPPGYKESTIIRAGMMLMERPIELTREAMAEQAQLAKTQVREAEQRLGMTPNGQLTREHEGVRPRVVKEMMRPQAIEE